MSFKQKVRVSRFFLAEIAALLIFSLLISTTTAANSFSRGYNTSDNELVVGMAASLSIDSTPERPSVERATISNKEVFVGITTTREASSVTVANKQSVVIITTQGNTRALVSNLEGEIKKGDSLTISPLRGFLVKLNPGASPKVAFALEDFTTDQARTEKIKLDDGSEREVKMGAISVDVLPPKEQIAQGNKQSSSLVTFVRSLTGRDVSQWKIFAAALVFFTLLVTVGSLMYGAIHSTIGAVGRNPLAKNEIYKHLIRIMFIALVILVLGGGIIYNLLWL